MKRLVCVPARKREEERKRGREGEIALNKRQGGPSLEQSLEPARPADPPVPQPGRADRRGSATEAEGPELELHAAEGELETKPGSSASQRGSNQRPELASLRWRRDPLRAGTGDRSPGLAPRSWVALASRDPPPWHSASCSWVLASSKHAFSFIKSRTALSLSPQAEAAPLEVPAALVAPRLLAREALEVERPFTAL